MEGVTFTIVSQDHAEANLSKISNSMHACSLSHLGETQSHVLTYNRCRNFQYKKCKYMTIILLREVLE